MEDSVEHLSEAKRNYIYYSPLIHTSSHFIMKSSLLGMIYLWLIHADCFQSPSASDIQKYALGILITCLFQGMKMRYGL